MGKGANSGDVMALTRILQEQYGKDTGDNPRNPQKLKVGHHWISEENMSAVMALVAASGNDNLKAKFKDFLPK